MNTLIFLGMFAVCFGGTIAILLSPWGQKGMNEYEFLTQQKYFIYILR